MVIDGQEASPIKQVQQRITEGAQYNVVTYYHTFARNSNNTNKPSTESRHEFPRGEQSANPIQPDGNIECPNCRNSMPSWYLVCSNCGYDLVGRGKNKLPERAPRTVSEKASNKSMLQCPNCHGYLISTGMSAGLLILHIILVFITSGIWLLVILGWFLLSPNRKRTYSTYQCKTCGYEWG